MLRGINKINQKMQNILNNLIKKVVPKVHNMLMMKIVMVFLNIKYWKILLKNFLNFNNNYV